MLNYQVSLVRCADYDSRKIQAAVDQAIGLLGGIERIVGRGQKVLLKPNLIKAASPEEAVTTHPEFIRAVIRCVRRQTDQIYIGDSPAGLTAAEYVYEQCGINRLCREEGTTPVKFDRIIKKKGLPFSALMEEMVCISLPKFKTHNLTTLTGAVKNVFGLIPGLAKVQCHQQAPNFRRFGERLVDIYESAAVQLHILDAVMAMEGDGPTHGAPRRLGLVAAGINGAALDSVMCKVIGLDPAKVVFLREATARKLCLAPEKIEILGETVQAVKVNDFRLPRISPLFRLPNFLSRFFLRLVPLAMKIDSRVCTNCGMCRRICPQQAVFERNGKMMVDSRRCILCFCCSEACPENAMRLRFINRRIRK